MTELPTSGIFRVKVVPGASRTELISFDDIAKFAVAAPPEKDKANKELLRFLKKEYGLRAVIKSGENSRIKVLEILE